MKIRYYFLLIWIIVTIDCFAQLSLIHNYNNGEDGISGLGNASDILISYDGRHLYTVTDIGNDIIAVFSRDKNGNLDFVGNVYFNELGPFVGYPEGIEIHPNDDYIYMFSNMSYGIRVFSRDSVSGNLTFYDSYTGQIAGIDNDVITDIKISNDGSFLYASSHKHIVSYRIENDSSKLTYLSKVVVNANDSGEGGLWGPKNMEIASNNKFLYTYTKATAYSSGISLYACNQDGSLSHIENYLTSEYMQYPDALYSIQISPDSRYLYGAFRSLYTFKIDSLTGHLDLLEHFSFENAEFDIDHIDKILIGNSGKQLTGISNRFKLAISFYRDIDSGSLSLKQNIHFNTNDNYVPAWLPTATFSEDLKSFYILSPYDKTISFCETHIPVHINKRVFSCGDSTNLFVDDGFSYLWSNGDTNNITRVDSIGDFSVYVTDSLERQGWDTISLKEVSKPIVSIFELSELSTHDTICLTSVVSFGTQPFNYFWNDGSDSSKTFLDRNSLANNYYSKLKVVDKNECVAIDSLLLNPSGLDQHNNTAVQIYPNPFNDLLIIESDNIYNEELIVEILSLNGINIFHYKYINFGTQELDLSMIKKGIYIVRISSNNITTSHKILKN